MRDLTSRSDKEVRCENVNTVFLFT